MCTRQANTTWAARAWGRRHVQAMLKNETYLGDMLWSRHPHDAVERLDTQVRPESEWVVTRDAHPAKNATKHTRR